MTTLLVVKQHWHVQYIYSKLHMLLWLQEDSTFTVNCTWSIEMIKNMLLWLQEDTDNDMHHMISLITKMLRPYSMTIMMSYSSYYHYIENYLSVTSSSCWFCSLFTSILNKLDMIRSGKSSLVILYQLLTILPYKLCQQ